MQPDGVFLSNGPETLNPVTTPLPPSVNSSKLTCLCSVFASVVSCSRWPVVLEPSRCVSVTMAQITRCRIWQTAR